MKRLARIIGLVSCLAVLVGAFALTKQPAPASEARLVTAPPPVQPLMPGATGLTTSWYCPGVPTVGVAGGQGGTFTLVNPTDTVVDATLTVFSVGVAPVSRSIRVGQRGRVDVAAAELTTAPYAAALVELAGAQIGVEQSAFNAAGISVTPCMVDPSAEWFFPDGSTRADASLIVLLFNPFPGDAVVDLAFADEEGARVTKKFEGRVVPARSLVAFDIGEIIQRKALVSVMAKVRDGVVIAGRVQSFGGGDSGRKGLVAGVGIAAAAQSWRFALGRKGPGPDDITPVADRLVIHNPTDIEAEVAVTVLTATDTAALSVGGDTATPGPAPPEPLRLTVLAHQSGIIDLVQAAGVPDGVFNMSVTASTAIAVERVIDYAGTPTPFTTVVPGSRLAAPIWHFPAGLPSGTRGLLSVLNSTGEPAIVVVMAIGAAGATPVAGYEKVEIPAGGVVTLPLGDKAVAGLPLVVESNGAIIVERTIISTVGWSSALGLPIIA